MKPIEVIATIMKYTLTKADLAGWKLNLAGDNANKTYYIGEFYEQGYVYKDKEAFNTGDGVCYIPECDFIEVVDIKEQVPTDVRDVFQKHNIQCRYFAVNVGYARQDMDEMVKDSGVSAEELFDSLDWSSPQALLRELQYDR